MYLDIDVIKDGKKHKVPLNGHVAELLNYNSGVQLMVQNL